MSVVRRRCWHRVGVPVPVPVAVVGVRLPLTPRPPVHRRARVHTSVMTVGPRRWARDHRRPTLDWVPSVWRDREGLDDGDLNGPRRRGDGERRGDRERRGQETDPRCLRTTRCRPWARGELRCRGTRDDRPDRSVDAVDTECATGGVARQGRTRPGHPRHERRSAAQRDDGEDHGQQPQGPCPARHRAPPRASGRMSQQGQLSCLHAARRVRAISPARITGLSPSTATRLSVVAPLGQGQSRLVLLCP